MNWEWRFTGFGFAAAATAACCYDDLIPPTFLSVFCFGFLGVFLDIRSVGRGGAGGGRQHWMDGWMDTLDGIHAWWWFAPFYVLGYTTAGRLSK